MTLPYEPIQPLFGAVLKSNLQLCDFSDEDIWDIAAITAFFGLSNRMVNFASIKPNAEFFNMARTWD